VQYNIHEAKTHLSRLLERAQQGEEIIICKAGQPYVKLVAVRPVERRQLGFMRGEFSVGEEIFQALDEDEIRAWENE